MLIAQTVQVDSVARLVALCPPGSVGVLVSSLQAFAKVRQLDAYTELFCAVSKNSPTLSISKESDDMNVSMTLACENKYQQTAQDALARCPAGQVKMLWNILERDLTRR